MNAIQRFTAGLAATCFTFGAHALEYPIGTPENVAGMEVADVYVQAIEMEPEGHTKKVAESDIDLEADTHALAGNPHGFAEGMWIPHLLVKYEPTKLPGGGVIKGDMMPRVASDGPQYGDNVKLNGSGKYKVKFIIYAPSAKENQRGAHFGRPTDRATGVRPWFKPVVTEWGFSHTGVGKKGGY
jgi:uncharacterized protein involved in high-affinity Fe2+ transport